MAQISEIARPMREPRLRISSLLLIVGALAFVPSLPATRVDAQVPSNAPAPSSACPSDDAMAAPADSAGSKPLAACGAAAANDGRSRHQGGAGHDHHRYRQHRALLRARERSRDPLLPNAFRYRDECVAGCTCNGKDTVGLARVKIEDDATLRKGGIVAASDG